MANKWYTFKIKLMDQLTSNRVHYLTVQTAVGKPLALELIQMARGFYFLPHFIGPKWQLECVLVSENRSRVIDHVGNPAR